MNKELNVRTKTMKFLGYSIGNMTLVTEIFFAYVSSDKRNETKNTQIGQHQTKKLFAQLTNSLTKWKGSLLNRRRYL